MYARPTPKNTRKEICLKIYKFMAIHVIIYGSENWFLTKSETEQIAADDGLRILAGCNLGDLRKSECKYEEIQIKSNLDIIDGSHTCGILRNIESD